MSSTKREKTGGRKKGTPNKKTLKVIEMLEELDYDPLREAIEMLRKPNISGPEALKLYNDYLYNCEQEGIDPDDPEEFIRKVQANNLDAKDRLDAHIKLIKYVYPARKAIEVSTDDEKEPPKFVINFANKGE